MAYKATVIPVMIASPGDVADEREVIRKVIARWNAANSWTSKVVLDPVGFDTHMAPGWGRPQQRINDQILSQCDLLIAVFWTRLGSPTGVAASGTIEEINAHIASGKPAMIYFSARPVVIDTIDEEQTALLKKFKAGLQQQAQYQVYESIHDFETRLTNQLDIVLARDPYVQEVLTPINQEPPKPTDPINSVELLEPERPKVTLKSFPPAPRVAEEQALSLTLTDLARSILRWATKDDDGMIMVRRYLKGSAIRMGNATMSIENERDLARAVNALDELEASGLVDRERPDFYRLTHLGWVRGDHEAKKAGDKDANPPATG